jgi:cell division protein FtsL
LKLAGKQTDAKKKKKRRPRSLVRRNLKNWLRYLPYILPLIITAFIYAWLHTRLTIVTLPVKSLRNQKTDLNKQNDSIRYCIEQLQDPRRIESIARKKLGMVSPENWQVVALEEPLRAFEASADTSRQTQTVSQSCPRTLWLFGFLRGHGILGDNSAKDLAPEPASRVKLSSVPTSTVATSPLGKSENAGRPGFQATRLGSGR